MTTLDTLRSLIAQGESETLELKRSTAELRRVGKNSGAVTVTFMAEIVPGAPRRDQAGPKAGPTSSTRTQANHGRTRSRWPRPARRDHEEDMKRERA